MSVRCKSWITNTHIEMEVSSVLFDTRFSCYESMLVDDSQPLTTALSNQQRSTAWCAQAIPCHWKGHLRQEIPSALIQLLSRLKSYFVSFPARSVTLFKSSVVVKGFVGFFAALPGMVAIRQCICAASGHLARNDWSFGLDVLLVCGSYFRFADITNLDFFCRTLVPLILQAFRKWAVLHRVFAESFSIGERPLHRYEMMLNLQQKTSSAIIDHCFSLFWQTIWVVIERMHSNDEKWYNRVGDYFYLLNLSYLKQRKVRKLPFTLLRVSSVRFIQEGSCEPIESIFVGGGWLLVILDERASGLSHEKDVILKRNVKTWVIKVRDDQKFCWWWVYT